MDLDDIRDNIIMIIAKLEVFKIEELIQQLILLDGCDSLYYEVAEHLLLTHPNISNSFGIFYWNSP